MSFTDDDLKRLKKSIDNRYSPQVSKPTWDEIEAILARLEAAEKVCIEAAKVDLTFFMRMPHPFFKDRINKAVEAWRASKGE